MMMMVVAIKWGCNDYSDDSGDHNGNDTAGRNGCCCGGGSSRDGGSQP